MLKLAGVVAALALLFPAVAGAKANPLVGKWRVVAAEDKGQRHDPPEGLEITVEFRDGGKFLATTSAQGKSKSEEGTWTSEKAKVTTVVKGKRETLGFEIKGKSLRLTAEKGPVLLLEKV